MVEKNVERLEKELKLKKEIEEIEAREDHWENSFINTMFASIFFMGVAGFIFYKKPWEGWLKVVWLAGGLAAITLLLGIFFYKWYREARTEEKKTVIIEV